MATHPHPRTAAEALQTKFDQILPHLDERRRRLYLASEATAIGHGGITLVAAASGTSTATIARGIAELAGQPAPTRRIRVPGGGRKPLTTTDSGLLPALEALIEPHTRGDPVYPLRWTTLSLRALASSLTDQGHPVSATTVGHLLHTLGYSLQGTAKTHEGVGHPDRDAQFAHLNRTAAAFLNDNQPVISIDTKTKEARRPRPVRPHLTTGRKPDQSGLPYLHHQRPAGSHPLRDLRHCPQQRLGQHRNRS